MSHNLIFLSIPPGHHGGISSNRVGIPQFSTYNLLNRFPPSLGLGDKFRDLKQRLFRISSNLSEEDKRRWLEYEPEIRRLIESHVLHPDRVRDAASYNVRARGHKKAVVIGCKDYTVQRMIQCILEDSGAEHLVKKLRFDSIEVNDTFTGHLTKTSSPLAPVLEKTNSGISSPLGSQLHIFHQKSDSSITTMGGVVLIDGKPYGLTTGCGILKQTLETEDCISLEYFSHNNFSGKVVACRYSGLDILKEGRTTEWQHAGAGILWSSPTKTPGDDRGPHSGPSADWGLVEIPGNRIPPNTLLRLRWESSEEWLWSDQEGESGELLVEQIVSEQDLDKLMQRGHGRVACLTYASSHKPIPGFIVAGTSTIVLHGAVFSVLRVDMEDPLDYGDSGSWVLVGKSVCGVIIAGSRDDCDQKPIFSAYMIPIIDVFNSISQTLSVTVSLPTLVDYRIDFLQKKRQAARWTSNNIPLRYMDLELLLAQQKEQKRGYGGFENLRLDNKSTSTLESPPLFQGLGWYFTPILGGLVGLHCETINQLLSLGEIFPLSAAFRSGLRQWAKDYRKFRFNSRRVFAYKIIIEKFLQAEAGENLLGLVVFFWKTQRDPSVTQGEEQPNSRSCRITWLAELLSSLFAIANVPNMSTPSTHQLEVFVCCIISAFKDKDLRHLYLSAGANYRGMGAEPSDEVWLAGPPPRQNAIQRYWHVLRKRISGRSYPDPLLDVDGALEELSASLSTWSHTVSATSRILALLHKIHSGDRTQVLVYCGKDAAWVAFCAAMVLGLKIDVRFRSANGSCVWPKEMAALARIDVIVYFNPQSLEECVCEILDRKSPGFPDPWERTIAGSWPDSLPGSEPFWTQGIVRPRR